MKSYQWINEKSLVNAVIIVFEHLIIMWGNFCDYI